MRKILKSMGKMLLIVLSILGGAGIVYAETLDKVTSIPKSKLLFGGTQAYMNLSGSDAYTYGFGQGKSLMRIPLPPTAEKVVLTSNGASPWGNFKAVYASSASSVEAVLGENPSSTWQSSGTTSISARLTVPLSSRERSDGEMWLFVNTVNFPGLTRVYVLIQTEVALSSEQITDWKTGSTVNVAAPYLSIEELNTINDRTPTFTGASRNLTGNPTLALNGKTYVVTPGAHSWNYTIPNTDSLADGTYTVTVNGGGLETSVSSTFTVSSTTSNPTSPSTAATQLPFKVDGIWYSVNGFTTSYISLNEFGENYAFVEFSIDTSIPYYRVFYGPSENLARQSQSESVACGDYGLKLEAVDDNELTVTQVGFSKPDCYSFAQIKNIHRLEHDEPSSGLFDGLWKKIGGGFITVNEHNGNFALVDFSVVPDAPRYQVIYGSPDNATPLMQQDCGPHKIALMADGMDSVIATPSNTDCEGWTMNRLKP